MIRKDFPSLLSWFVSAPRFFLIERKWQKGNLFAVSRGKDKLLVGTFVRDGDEGREEFQVSSVFSWRKQWHPTPVLLPGKSMDGGAW